MHTIYNISTPPRRARDSKRPSEQRLLSRDDLEAPVHRVPVVDAERDDGDKQSEREGLARDLLHGSEQFAESCERDGEPNAREATARGARARPTRRSERIGC